MKVQSVILLFFLSFSSLLVNSQVITADPEFPTLQNSVTIYFNSSLGNQALKDFTGDIYAHTGLITSASANSGDWKHVIAGWTENTTKAKLSRISSNLYQLTISPSIKEFYGVAEGEEVLKIAFVFRNSDGSKVAREADAGDIFYNVYSSGLNVNIISPTPDLIISSGDQITIKASSNISDSMFLYIDNNLIADSSGKTISLNYTENIAGTHKILVKAKKDTVVAKDSVYFQLRGEPAIAELPEGWKKGINYLADDSVGLVLFAPHKEFVYVIGDFTDWRTNEDYLMNITPNDSVYWIAIGGLTPGMEYIYQYYINGSLRIADPYTEKTSDPNDKYIPTETYPGLISYPSENVTGIASVLQTNQTEYIWQNTDFVTPNKDNLIIYELHIRDFIAKHNYQTLIDTLDYLENLGINTIELMPVNEFEGNESWGYNPSFYFAPDKYYGTKNKLKEFIDSCHGRGIAVLIDMVLNHSYGQSPLVQMYFENGKPSSQNPWYNVQSPNSTYSWGYDFNHESIYTKEFVDSVNKFWLVNYKVDGFRFDFTKGFTNTPGDGGAYDASRIGILKRMYMAIKETNPNTIVILEHFAENAEEKSLADFGMLLWGNINYQYNEASMGYTSDISWGSYKSRNWSMPHLVSYMESHDEERLMYKNLLYGNTLGNYNIKEINTAFNRIELVANFFIPIPGPKMIWQFGELGYDYSIDYECRVCNKPIRWDYYEVAGRKRIYDVYSALNKLKNTYPVFSTTDYSIVQSGKLKFIYLNSTGMNVVIVGNFDMEPKSVIPTFQKTGKWYEFYSGDSITVTSAPSEITLKQGEYRIYTDVKLYKPEITVGIDDQIEYLNGNVMVYPNPSTGVFYFQMMESTNQNLDIKVYNISGQLVLAKSGFGITESIEIDISGLNNGLYFYELSTEAKRFTGRLIKN
jgi:glycosidase